jgi:hypothetical protein
MKYATCKRCGHENLIWAQSKKGNWYLSDPKTISTKTYGKYISIPFAHKCQENANYEPGFENGRNESFLINLQPSSGA